MHVIDQGSGSPLLLVHGFPLDHSMWKYQIEELSKSFRVICPDLPGFGKSEASPKPITLSGLVHDLADLLDSLEVAKVTYCGLSMGGYIGWQFWKHHADRIDALIACDTRAAADTETVARGRSVSAVAVRKNGMESLAFDMLPKLFAEQSLLDRSQDVEMIRQTILNCTPEMVAQAQLAMADRPDATDWLAAIEVPMLFVVGEQDQITTPQEMRTNAALVPHSKFVEIENAGHLSPLENPQAFNQAVNDFLAQ